MKLLRVEASGSIKPALLDDSGSRRDLSSLVPDITAATLSPDMLAR